MAFSSQTVEQAWRRTGGRCECERRTHGHLGRCGASLKWANRGRSGAGAWEANHSVRLESGGSDALSNCEILCWSCHRQTF